MIIERLSAVLFCLIKIHKAAVSSLHDLDKTVLGVVPSISGLNSQMSRMTLESGKMESSKPLLSPFEISEKMNTLIGAISALNKKTAVEMIEAGLVQILESGVCLHDIAPTIGSLPIEAKELVLAAIENKAYTLLRLLQKVYIWRDERQYHWFMALSYGSPWYDKDMWEDPELVPLDWENNLQTICEVENVALATMLKEKALQGNVLEDFNAKLLSLCIEYDSVKIFELTNLKPVQLKHHFESLARNSAAKLLRLYQTNTGSSHLHLEEYPFPSKLPTNVEDFEFLMKNGYNFLPMYKFIEKICKEGQLNLLKYLQELDPRLIPSLEELKYSAVNNFVDILDWARHFTVNHNFSYSSICSALLENRHFDTLFWWIELNEIIIDKDAIEMIIDFGALKVLQWVIKSSKVRYNFQRVANRAAWNRHVPILEWVYENYKTLPCSEFLVNATGEMLEWIKSRIQVLNFSLSPSRLEGIDAKYAYLVEHGAGNFKLLQWVFKNAPIYVFDPHREKLSEKIKGMEMMLWLHKELKICPFKAEWAYLKGNLKAIQWVTENCGVYPTEKNIKDVARNGHLDIIIWVHKNVYPKRPICFAVGTLKTAIENGNLEIAEYLVHNIFPEAKMEVFIRFNIHPDKHLSILKWAHEHGFGFGRPESEMATAIRNGDVQALEWLSANLPACKPSSGMRWDLLGNNWLKSYSWFLEKYPTMHQSDDLSNDAYRAYNIGSLGILKILHDKYPLLLRSMTFSAKDVKKANYHVYQWIIANGYSVK